jgi:hypothetical protein
MSFFCSSAFMCVVLYNKHFQGIRQSDEVYFYKMNGYVKELKSRYKIRNRLSVFNVMISFVFVLELVHKCSFVVSL